MNLAIVPSGQLNGRRKNMVVVAKLTVAHATAVTAVSPIEGGSICKYSRRNGTVKYLHNDMGTWSVVIAGKAEVLSGIASLTEALESVGLKPCFVFFNSRR